MQNHSLVFLFCALVMHCFVGYAADDDPGLWRRQVVKAAKEGAVAALCGASAFFARAAYYCRDIDGGSVCQKSHVVPDSDMQCFAQEEVWTWGDLCAQAAVYGISAGTTWALGSYCQEREGAPEEFDFDD